MKTRAKYPGNDEQRPPLFRAIRRIVWRLFPKFRLSGEENLPEEPCVIVGNHSQVYGPLAAEFYMPRKHSIWCIGEMMNRKEVPAYAFAEFWSEKPRASRWFYRAASHLIAPVAGYIFPKAHTIPVYHDARVMTTFRKSVDRLKDGADIVIFPESHEPYNGIVWQFQEHFADLATLYFKRTGREVRFVPMYTAPELKTIRFGAPVRCRFDAEDSGAERTRVCTELMDAITRLAAEMPPHRVVPYVNIPKKEYPLNTDGTAAGAQGK